jgi:hypothetical protein
MTPTADGPSINDTPMVDEEVPMTHLPLMKQLPMKHLPLMKQLPNSHLWLMNHVSITHLWLMNQVPMTHIPLMNQAPMTHVRLITLYFFFFSCLGVTFKAFGDPLESVHEVSSLYVRTAELS